MSTLSVLCHSYNVSLEEVMKIQISNVNFYTIVSAIFQEDRQKHKGKNLCHIISLYYIPIRKTAILLYLIIMKQVTTIKYYRPRYNYS